MWEAHTQATLGTRLAHCVAGRCPQHPIIKLDYIDVGDANERYIGNWLGSLCDGWINKSNHIRLDYIDVVAHTHVQYWSNGAPLGATDSATHR